MSVVAGRSLHGRREFAALLCLFFLSGSAGLVYQLLWLRMLTLAFGTTTFAVSTVLTSFMAGLGLGSELSGRLLTRRGRALLLFGLFEIGIGLYAVALHALLGVAELSFASAVAGRGLTFYAESLLRLVMSLALLLPPTALMGATLPLLAQHAVERFSHLGVRVGSLYALNTLGAVVGCFLAGFVAIAHLGIQGTTVAAASVNGLVGLTAIWLHRRRGPAPPPAPEASEAREPAAPILYPRPLVIWAIVAFAVSGFAALGLELVWTRLLTLVFKGYTYSFSTMLTVFLLGIGAGSLAFGRPADRARDPIRLFALLEMAFGVSVLALGPLFAHAQGWVNALALDFGAGWRGYAAAKFVVGFALLIVPTFLSGAAFPVVSRVAARSLAGVGSAVGRLYAANVAGGILGAFATGFLLIPAVGTDFSLRILGAGLLTLGLLLLVASPSATRTAKAVPALVGAAAALVVTVASPRDVSRVIHESWLRPGERISFYREGAEATVMVGEAAREGLGLETRILVGGSSASNSSHFGLSVNRIQGVLPFLFERTPRRVLAMCFGTGITFGTLTQFEVERVDGVEISPEVIAASPRFAAENYGVVRDPRLRLHIDDGRNFLLKSRERYDAITMEPMPPALAGVVNFYTRDFYALCRRRLAPGGVVSQWVPLYYLGPDDVRMLYRTFAESFPHAMAFSTQLDTFLVGSDQPLDLSGLRFRERLRSKRLAGDLARLRLNEAEQILGTFLMGREAMLRFAGSAPVLTDDLPYVEFSAPKRAGLDFVKENARALFSFAEPASDYLRAEAEAAPLREALDRRHRERLTEVSRVLSQAGPAPR